MEKYKVITEQCTGDQICVAVCPQNAISLVYGYVGDTLNRVVAKISVDDCIRCDYCRTACSSSAISVVDSDGGHDGFDGFDDFGGFGGGGSLGPHPLPPPSNGLTITDVFNDLNIDKFKDTVAKLGLINDIKALNIAGIERLIASIGAEPFNTKILNLPLLNKVAISSTFYNGYNVYMGFTDGDISNKDISDIIVFGSDVLSYVPGPIGILFTGMNIILAIGFDRTIQDLMNEQNEKGYKYLPN